MTVKYSDEFKEQALDLARETSVGEASRRLGVLEKAIYTWCQAKRLSEKPEPIIRGLEAQNKSLLKENEELCQTNTILKKAMGFFVKG